MAEDCFTGVPVMFMTGFYHSMPCGRNTGHSRAAGGSTDFKKLEICSHLMTFARIKHAGELLHTHKEVSEPPLVSINHQAKKERTTISGDALLCC